MYIRYRRRRFVFLRNQQSYARATANQGRDAIAPVVINNDRVSVGRIPQQLGQLHPGSIDRRQQAHRAHIADTWQPRGPSINPLVEPLPRREQVAMTYRFDLHLQRQLSAGRLHVGNQGRLRKSFRDIDPINISPQIPVTNPITGRSHQSLPPLLSL